MASGRRVASLVITTVMGVGAVVLLFIIGTTVRDLVAGRSINGRVVSCAYRSCAVAWHYGSAHGTTSVDGLGHREGDVMRLLYVPGQGVTNRSGDIVALVISLAFLALIALLFWRGKRGRAAAA